AVRRAREQQPWPRVLRDSAYLVDRGACVERREHRTQLRERGEDRDRFERGVAPPEDPVARLDPGAAEALGDTVRGLVERAERPPVVIERCRDRIGRDPRRIGEYIADEEHAGMLARPGATGFLVHGSHSTTIVDKMLNVMKSVAELTDLFRARGLRVT